MEQGNTVLAFDSKPTLREFVGFHDIPVCYQPTTDPLVLIGLLEAKRKARLNPLYATLGRISQRATTIQDIIKNARVMEETSRSGFIKDACWTLADLLKRLDEELSQIQFSETLELKKGEFNVMPVNKLSTEAKQLVLKTAFEELLKHHNRNVIAIIDEGFEFLPQDYSSACKRAIQTVITQGAKTKLFVWLLTQFLAPTEKDAMKAMPNKLLGRQDHNTEIKATSMIIPGAKKLLSADDLMTLKRGEFFLVPLEGKVRKVYVDRPVLPVPYAPKLIYDSVIDGELRTMEKNMLAAMHTTIEQFKEEHRAEISQLRQAVNDVNEAQLRKFDARSDLDENQPHSEINIGFQETHVHVHPEESLHKKLSTKTLPGKVMYVTLNDLKGGPVTQAEISDAMREYSWVLHPETLRLTLVGLVTKQGLLIRDGSSPAKFRRPGKITLTVEKA